MKQTNFYTEEELREIGFKSLGENVKISRLTSIYNPELMNIGSNVRIEDFCVLNGSITIGNHVIICSYCLLEGTAGIIIGNHVALAVKVSIHSCADDYSGETLLGYFTPNNLENGQQRGEVVIRDHVILADSVVVMPAVTISEGTAVGALSFVKSNTEEWSITVGVPARKIKNRCRRVKELYNKYIVILKSSK